MRNSVEETPCATPLMASVEAKAVAQTRTEIEKQQMRVRNSLNGDEIKGTPHAKKLQAELDELLEEYDTLKEESRKLEEEWSEAAEIEKAKANTYKVLHVVRHRISDPRLR